MLECIVTKFGGSSLANDEQFRKVRSILELEPTRRYLVPSAPGKRFKEDDKVTDLLYLCHSLASEGKPIRDVFARIRDRYLSIADGLRLTVDISSALDEVEQGIAGGKGRDHAGGVSRAARRLRPPVGALLRPERPAPLPPERAVW